MNAAVFFAERLGAIRALTSEETDVLCTVVTTTRHFWTAKEDRQLLEAMRKHPRNYAAVVAAETGRSPWSIRSRARKVGK